MRPSLAIFDLDGTLADSLPWFRRHVNEVADRFGFRRVAEHEIEDLRSAPAREILRRLEVPLWKVPMIAYHMQRLKAQYMAEIPLFPGTDAMLRALQEGGIGLALVSSDNEANARTQLGPENTALFSVLECGASLFGKAEKFRRVLASAGVDASRVLSFGDETRDIEAARGRHSVRRRHLGLCGKARTARAQAGLRVRADRGHRAGAARTGTMSSDELFCHKAST